MFFYSFLKSLLFLFDPEIAHRITINYLKFARFKKPKLYEVLQSEVFGLNFQNPIGIAAGFDKNGEVAHNLINLGFGFSEVGTVTPKPQPGNPRPRVFRLKDDRAIINRLGFNSVGFSEVKTKLEKIGDNIIGVNIGANKNSKDFSEDYIKGIKFFSTLASYITINISSPNTPGLRNLEVLENLDVLLDKINNLESEDLLIKIPILLKISPDLEADNLKYLCEKVLSSKIDGLIISNTTISRDSISTDTLEKGGLSGKPIFDISTKQLRMAYKYTNGKIPLIGVGGVDSAEKAYEKIKNGASLIQLYTGLVYNGPNLIKDINEDLSSLIERDGYSNISEAVGAEVN
ncbi:MAG: quinone-dependent dihydroorotate dehydrogenase [Alphaproteobacteria bacterium]|nr:quinone-dependent dihydroorotate dehydrogenase [Alphaproteobacteria bacterium]MDG1152974.1 quinone-dependent dihydroorotate dehydrogenase [Hyphomicrobiales bacterium]